jgi:hypothetical protein
MDRQDLDGGPKNTFTHEKWHCAFIQFVAAVRRAAQGCCEARDERRETEYLGAMWQELGICRSGAWPFSASVRLE